MRKAEASRPDAVLLTASGQSVLLGRSVAHGQPPNQVSNAGIGRVLNGGVYQKVADIRNVVVFASAAQALQHGLKLRPGHRGHRLG